MNIGANVSARAEKTFCSLMDGFKINMPISKVNSFLYETKDSEDEWSFRYVLEKTWISRIYKLRVSYSFPISMADEDIVWNHWKKRWQPKGKEVTPLSAVLNEEAGLKNLIRTVDFEKVHVTIKDQRLTIDLIPVPGCFVWTLIPPMHYFVKLKSDEYRAMERIFSMMKESCVNARQGVPNLELVLGTHTT